jgi:hypothetical protein
MAKKVVYICTPQTRGRSLRLARLRKKVGNKFGSNEKLPNFAPAFEVKKKLAEESKFFEEMERKKVA